MPEPQPGIGCVDGDKSREICGANLKGHLEVLQGSIKYSVPYGFLCDVCVVAVLRY